MIKTPQSKSLTLLQWNCRGIINKRELLPDLIEHFDILAFSETWLTPCRKLYFPNHHILRQDGPSNHSGGILLAVRKNIPYHKATVIPSNSETIEAIGIEIPASIKPLLIVSIYKHPGPSDPLLWENFFFPFRSFSHAHIVLTGDFNAHHTSWGCHHSDLTGKLLLEASLEHQLFIINDGTPTRINHPISPQL